MTRASFILRILFATFCLFNYCSCGSENILKSYEEYYNRENSNFTYEDGILYNLERVDTSKYKIEITIKVKEQANPKSFRLLKCSATLLDNAGTLTVDENQCEDGTSGSRSTNEAADVSSELENSQDETTELSELATTESDDARQAVNLDSEVQSDNAQINSSEEQFVAIPRPQPSSTPCIGCSSLVDNNAPGVEALANLAVRHINKHTPDSAYKLKSILQVERQVQVVNGVRYLLTIVISDSSCVETQANDCPGIKTCKISILEKPWLKISNGKKFRAVLSNNCTEQWLYGDEGEELLTKDDDVTNADDEVIKVIKNIDVQATPNSERKLTEEELKELEEQIIPTNEIGRQKRNAYVDTGVEVVLEPKSLYLQDLAIEAFEKYSLKKDLRFRVVYATRLLGVHGETTRIDFNVRLQPTVEDETNEDNMRCHSRISENDVNIKSFYTYCIHIDNGLNGAIEMPASNPTFRPVALEKLRSEYGNLLKFDEVIRVYVDAGKQNIIFDAKSSANDVYRCYFIIHENVNMPLVCKLQEPENSPVHKIEKDPTATKYLHLSMVTLKKYLIYSNITEPYIIAAVTHASESNGPLTNIDIDFIAVAKNATLRCISQIEENKESNISSIVVNCSTIPERKDYPAGVIIERNPFDENYIKIAMEALKKNYSHLNYRDLRVVYANEQLLDTLITRIDFEINLKNSTGFRCHVKLLQKLSEKMEDEYVDCFPKSEINLGGRIDHNASDPENWKSAEESLIRKYNNTLVLLEVVRFTTQVVEGVASETDFYAISPLDKIVHHCHSQKLHQPWHNVSEINVECKPKNATPIPTTGEIVEQDPSDPKYKAVALEALSKKYPSYSNEALKIVYVNEQLVNGVVTRLDFDTGENNASIFRCHVNLYENPKDHFRKLYIDCFPKAPNLLGGKFEHNASDPNNWKHAKEYLVQEYNSSLKLLDVIRVTTAVSAGLTTETDFYAVSDSDKVIHLCHSSQFDEPWNNVSDLNIECKPTNATPIPTTGGIVEQDPSFPKYKVIALEALAKKYPSYSNEALKIVYVSEQLDNGVITRLDFDTGENNASIFRCHVKLYETSKENVSHSYIDCFPKALNLPGGKFEHNASDPDNWKQVEESLAQKYNSSLQLLDVVRVTTAISNGVTTETDFYAVSNSDKVINTCHSRRFEAPLNNVSELNVECKPKNAKPSSISGEIIEQDPSDPKYEAIALEALAKAYPDYSNESLKIVYVSEQLVNGVITRFDFDTGENYASIFRCHVKLYETLKENIKKVYITCFPKALNILGGKFEQNASDPSNWKYVEASLAEKYNSSLQLLDVVRVTTAISNGVTTETDFYAVSNSDKIINLCHSRRFETPMNNVSELNVECKPKNAKPSPIPGGIVEQDPSDPKYKAAALEALGEKYPSYSNKDLKIVYVNEQLDNGVITRLDFDTGENNASIFRCHVKLYETSKENVSNSYIDCFPKALNLPGGKFEHNASDPDNWKQVEESLAQKYNSSLQLLDVVRVTTAVSNGFTTETDFYAISNSDKVINLCHSRRFETPLNNVSELNVECKPKNAKPCPVPGEIVVQDPSDPKYKAVALEALAEKYPSYSNEALKIVCVNEQLDNGVITRLDFDTGENYASIFRCHVKLYETSKKNVSNSYIDCFPKAPNLTGGKFEHNASDPDNWKQVEESLAQKYNSSLQLLDVVRVTTAVSNGFTTETDFYAISNSDKVINLCHSRRFETPLNNVSELNVECKPKNAKPSPFPGGIVEQDPSDPKYKAVALEALAEKYPSYSNEALKIVYVNEQLDNGVITRLDFDTGENNASIVRCHVKLYETSEKKVSNSYIDCFPKAPNLTGGKFEHNASDPDNWKQVEESLAQKYKSSLQLLDVVRVTTAVSNGFTTETDFYAISNSDKVINLCHSRRFETPLNNVSELNVECKPKNAKPSPFPGGIVEQDPSDPKYKAVALEALAEKYPSYSNEALKIVYVNEQLDNGVITRLDFDTGENNASIVRCHVKLYETPRENVRKLYIDCFPQALNLDGGKFEHNASDPDNWKQAEKSLAQKYNSSLQLLDVVRVTTAISNGFTTETDFYAVSDSDEVIHLCHSTELDAPWRNVSELNVECKPKAFNPVTGDIIEKDPKDPELIEIAKMALKTKYPDINYHSLSVVYVNKQFLNGLITRFDFDVIDKSKISDSRCHVKLFRRIIENERNLTVNCFSKETDGRIELNASDPRNWQNAKESLDKELGSSLSLLDVLRVTTRNGQSSINETDFDAISKISNVVYRCHTTIYIKMWEQFKDTELSCEPLLRKPIKYKKGGKIKKDPSDPIFSELANKSLTHFLATTNNNKPYRVAQVLHASEYVTNGFNTELHFIAVLDNHTDILKCFSKIWERSSLNRTAIKVICSSVMPKPRPKRWPGSKKQRDPKNPIYYKLARKSLSQYLDSENVETQYKILVEEVTTQAVSGVSTDIHFTAISVDNSGGHKCHANIWERGWITSLVISVKCNPLQPLGRQKREKLVPGGITERDPKDPKFLTLARKSLRQYFNEDATSNELQLTIKEVNTQVVAGLITRIVFIAKSPSNSDAYKCKSEILERPWENTTTINVNCTPLQPRGRKKREQKLLGGFTQQDPKHPKFLPLARKSLSQYLKEDTSTENLHLTIEEVSTKEVEDIITRLVFIAKSHSYSGGYKCKSEILENLGEESDSINVDCSPLKPLGRTKREQKLLGGFTRQDPKDPKFLPLARKSLSQYLKEDATSNQLQLTIEEVSTQVVAGLITRMVFIAKSSSNADGYKCNSEILERVWENATSINVNCSPLQPLGREKREEQVSGGITQQDPKDPKFLPLARKSLSQYLKGDATSDQLQLTIEEVSTQVVAGLITRMVFKAKSSSNSDGYKCNSEILERAWENILTINVDCTPLQLLGRKKREQNLLGGITQQDPKDPKFLPLAKKSLSQYLKGDATSNQLQLTIEEVSTQVVAGLITRMVFIAKSYSNSDGYKCNSEILERAWENATSINVNCSPLQSLGREKREKQVSGGITQQDPKDPKFLPLARKSLSQYLKGDATSNQLQLTIEEVSTQVVAGLITRMVFVAKSSSNSDGYKCSSEILERAWENSTTINVNCTPLQPLGRKKRQIIVGRKTSQDPNDPKYLSLARNSLSQYLQVEDTGNQFQLSVKRVTTQVVAGISTELDFFAQSLENSDEYKCNAVIWERSWLNSTIIRVNCSPFLTSLDPNDQQVLALAELSLCTYLHIDKISFVNEIKVKKAIVNDGPKKSLILVFQAISKTTFGELKCQSYIWERPVRNYTVVDVHCSPLHNNVRRTSRNAKLNQTKPQDPSDIKYLSLAKESLTHYADLIGSSTQYQISVEQVTTTTVSGVLTQIHFIAAEKLGFNILRCHSEIWEQPWLNSTKFDVICNPFPREERSVSDIVPSKGHYIEKDVRDKRSTDSIKKKNDEINSSELLVDNEDKIEADHLANEALKYINAKYRHPQQMKVKSILSFAKDHYSAHYRIKMEVGFTNCLALSPKAEDCSLVNDMGVHKFCRVSVRLLLDTDQPPRFKVSCDIDENLIEINKNRQAESLFLEFIELYKPTYVNNFKEIRKRLEIFKENIEKIHELNTHERGTARYGVTKFSDLNKEEFSTRYLGLKPHLANPNPMTMTKAEIPNIALPDSIDWRERGAVTEVKNQGACGSCWAFSVTGNIEGQWKLKSGQLVSLSEQELVDCDTADHGCNGGLPDNAYRAIEQLGGLETEQDYPYEATHDSCSFNKTLSKVQISGAVNITSNETAMAMWTAEHGPISIGLNANGMQFYFGGVSHPWKILCNPMNLDHGVLIVGFGVKEYKLFNNTLPYWIIKNSWGPSWGEEGYYRLYRGDGSCGVDQMASSAVIN